MSEGGTIFYPSCFLRYGLVPFYRSNPTDAPQFVPESKFSQADYLHHNCSTHVPADSAFQMDLKTLLSHMSSNATIANKSYFKEVVDGSVYGLFMCRAGLPSRLCQQCVLNATSQIFSHCNSTREAIIWYTNCMIRYSYSHFFSDVDRSPNFQVLNASTAFTTTTIPSQDFFTFMLSDTLSRVAESAGGSIDKYANASSKLNDLQTLYAFGQCTQDLSSDGCKACLQDINEIIPWTSLGSVGGRVLYPSCNIRFELFQFYGDDQAAHSPRLGNPALPLLNRGKKEVQSRKMILIIVLTIVSVTILILLGYLTKRKGRKSDKTILRENFGEESVALEPLQFKLAVIEVATNNFSNENRIGKGGFEKSTRFSMTEVVKLV
ncbi:hypothetical protein Fmac_005554 [Flemingia macrophylla]|uniref:Gnk2-homologous domain-containing protein n=1 Tax=Flemingia macrophylla TaxID=520843 RepID=A0ABD1N861_9FABA